MKARQSFVSNSSSSSFVLIGKKVTTADILEGRTTGELWAMGGYYGEGQDVFEFTNEMKTVLKICPYPNVEFIEGQLFDTDGKQEIELCLNGKYTVCGGGRDYHSTSDVDEFIERYCEIEPEEYLANIGLTEDQVSSVTKIMNLMRKEE